MTYSFTYHPTTDKTFLEQEEEIAEMAAAFGRAITTQLLEQYDAHGEPLQVDGQRMSLKDSQKNLLHAIRGNRSEPAGVPKRVWGQNLRSFGNQVTLRVALAPTGGLLTLEPRSP